MLTVRRVSRLTRRRDPLLAVSETLTESCSQRWSALNSIPSSRNHAHAKIVRTGFDLGGTNITLARNSIVNGDDCVTVGSGTRGVRVLVGPDG